MYLCNELVQSVSSLLKFLLDLFLMVSHLLISSLFVSIICFIDSISLSTLLRISTNLCFWSSNSLIALSASDCPILYLSIRFCNLIRFLSILFVLLLCRSIKSCKYNSDMGCKHKEHKGAVSLILPNWVSALCFSCINLISFSL